MKKSGFRIFSVVVIMFMVMIPAGCMKSERNGRKTNSNADVSVQTGCTTATRVSAYTAFTYQDKDRTATASTFVLSPFSAGGTAETDRMISFTLLQYDAGGVQVRTIFYDGPGRDGTWHTGDDDVDRYSVLTENDNGKPGREAIYNTPGPDAAWFTGDDSVESYRSWTYDVQDRIVRSVEYDTSGPDGIFFTADDRPASYRTYSSDEAGRRLRETLFYDSGPDGIWFTSDDLIGFSLNDERNAHGVPTRTVRFDDPGTDKTWLTADDRPGLNTVFLLEGDRVIAVIEYDAPGPDGLWFTEDDDILKVITKSYDEAGGLTRENEFDAPGPDGTWFTPDDFSGLSNEYVYNDNGMVTQRTRHAAAGAPLAHPGSSFLIGVFYFPGWNSASQNYWPEIQGLPGSLSPGIAWPDRVPLLGYYLEDQTGVAEKHIAWAARYGITFFAYDWYWDGSQPLYDNALRSHLRAKNRLKMKFSLLWADHSDIPSTLSQFDDMVSYWITNYFNQPDFLSRDGKPVVFLFSHDALEANARKFGWTASSLLVRADGAVRKAGYPGIYLVVATNERPSSELELLLKDRGYSAYTGWNYVAADNLLTADYSSMVDTYRRFYNEAGATSGGLPYFVPASPGWDARPWKGAQPSVYVRENSTPEKFEKMLISARRLLSAQTGTQQVLMIEAWNEFGEGAYIEPTKRWGTAYLEAIRRVFGPVAADN